ncbi:MAG: hypothetical protein ACYTFI_16255 [Planctomycetota bacterium]
MLIVALLGVAAFCAWAASQWFAADMAVWLTAVGTIFLGLVAILHEWFGRLLWHPELEITFERGDCPKTPLRGGADGYYFRFRVWNNGSVSAKNVEVCVEKLDKQGTPDYVAQKATALPLNLQWTHFDRPFLESVSPGTYRNIDFGLVGKTGGASAALFSLRVVQRAAAENLPLDPGKYRLALCAAAANAKAARRTFDLEVTGDWYEDQRDMLSRGIVIS